jgi:hypothetical protein
MEERRLSAVVLVQQSMLNELHKSANFTLDVTTDEITLKVNGIPVNSQPIRSHRIVYKDSYRSERATHVARALGIQAEKVITIAFTSRYDKSMFIEVNGFVCRAIINYCEVPLSLEEATAAFVKLKEIGFKIEKEQW